MIPNRDPFESPEGKEWAESVRREMLPKLEQSALSVTIYSGGVDVKLAVELGAAILLDKPIILCVTPGTKIPEHLERAADRIIEADLHDGARTAEKIRQAVAEYGVIQ